MIENKRNLKVYIINIISLIFCFPDAYEDNIQRNI